MDVDSFAAILTIVIVLLGVLAYNCISNILGLSKDLETPKLEHCKVHNWYLVQDERGTDMGLLCINCNKTPIQIQQEGEVK